MCDVITSLCVHYPVTDRVCFTSCNGHKTLNVVNIWQILNGKCLSISKTVPIGILNNILKDILNDSLFNKLQLSANLQRIPH
jgi:hypothetical protein